MFIIDAIKRIKNSKRVLFTTPSHSQGSIIPSVVKNLIGLKAFQSDMSETDGLDNLKHPENCILKSQEKAAQIYGAQNTFYLVNGSSSGMLALMLTTLKENDKVLIARNAHESVFNGLVLTGAVPVWFAPDYCENFDVLLGVTLENVEDAYRQNPDVKALIITSPTYEGVCSDIKKIAEFCSKKGIVFIVDEAHGGLLSFSEKLPRRAIDLGADATVQSLHKTTPALTGSALLHIKKNSLINPKEVQKNLNLINSTSPSWLILASIEGAIEYLNSKKGRIELNNLIENIEKFKNIHSSFKFLEGQNCDPTKILIKKDGVSGEVLSYFLSENNIEDELVTQKAVLCLCGIGTTKKKLRKLSKVLKKFSSKITKQNFSQNEIFNLPQMKLTPKQAHLSKKEVVKSKNAIGKIIGENITPYPPCIPVLMAGEIIEERHLKYLASTVCIVSQ